MNSRFTTGRYNLAPLASPALSWRNDPTFRIKYISRNERGAREYSYFFTRATPKPLKLCKGEREKERRERALRRFWQNAACLTNQKRKKNSRGREDSRVFLKINMNAYAIDS